MEKENTNAKIPIMEKIITIYRNAYNTQPYYITLQEALNRIKNGRSKDTIAEIRKTQDKGKKSELKKNLPSVVFAGKIVGERKDTNIVEHSGFVILDFDHTEDVEFTKKRIFECEHVKAVWVSPSGDGLKALFNIADGSKHREHYEAIKDLFPELDAVNINPSRLCFESYDPKLLERETTKVFTKLKTIEKVMQSEATDYDVVFDKILIWLNNSGSAFVSGERNLYIFKLAGACCRFGINEQSCISLITSNVTFGSSDFSRKEIARRQRQMCIRDRFGSAEFKNEKLVEKATYKEVQIDESIYDLNIRPKDVIYGIDVKADALSLYRNGYEKVLSTGIPELDTYFKFKKGELTLLTGIGNYGKSTFMKFLLLIQILNGKKIAVFSPEDAPAHEFYNDFVEMYFGKSCIFGFDRPSEIEYERVYDLITKNIFFIYPKDLAPTPDYIKERFLELIIKEKVEFCMIDPFNQMTNEYSKSGGRTDKYLETLLSDFGRFARTNEVYFVIVAHPKALQKNKDGNYPCPDVFDIADGAMWNNKMDNILVYHLPYRQVDEQSPICEFHSKKIRKRKVVGAIGSFQFTYDTYKRRFIIEDKDYLGMLLKEDKKVTQPNLKHEELEEMFNNSGTDQYGNSETPF